LSSERYLLLYCLLVGAIGWAWLFVALEGVSFAIHAVLLFLLLAAAVEIAGFRSPPDDPHSLVGVVHLTALLVLGPAPAALAAGIVGLVLGVVLPLVYGRPRTPYALLGRPLLRSGQRICALLGAAALASALDPNPSAALLLLISIPVYVLAVGGGRALREYLADGPIGLRNWWRNSWRPSLSAEVLPLPLAALGAAVYQQLPWPYFALAIAGLILACYAVRRTSFAIQRQRVSVRELSLLNASSRALIRSELNVEQLCEVVYSEASKIVDTSSFHLGLFRGDSYAVMVRVQDRVRKPPLTVTLGAQDGIVGWMRRTRRSLLVRDFQTEMEQLPARPTYHSEHPPRAGIYIPLVAGQEVIGSISIQSYTPNAFDTEDLRVLSLIADQAAVAIARAQAFAEAKWRATQLQAISEVGQKVAAILHLDELLPAVVMLIRERFGYHPVHIFTTDAEAGEVVFRASSVESDKIQQLRLPLGAGIVGSVAHEGVPMLVPDVRQEPRYRRDEQATLSELAVPIRVGRSVIGVLDVQSSVVDDFDDSDLFVIKTLADQIAIAIDSANLYAQEQEEAWTLNCLLQLNENVARRSNLDDLLATLSRLPTLLIGCDRCALLRWQEDTRTYLVVASYGFSGEHERLLREPMAEADAPLLATMRQAGQLVVLEDATTQSGQLPPFTDQFGCDALLAAPLLARGRMLGALIVEYCGAPHRFTRREIGMYGGFANQTAAALERALLAQEAEAASRLEQELRVAREIQTSLLPAQPPHVAGYSLAADWRSAKIVGGDFYDFWWLPATRGQASGVGAQETETNAAPTQLGFVIADVSDKGVPAALYMALSRSLVRAAALDGSSPAQALTRANRWITRDTESGMFVTLFYGVLDTITGELIYTCAGHNPPLHYHAATSTWSVLRTPGIALGVLDEVSLGQATTTLAPGDLLVCYTDGVTEAINTQEEPFEVERLQAAVARVAHQPAAAAVAAVRGALQAFSDGQPPFDDVTLVIIQRLATPAAVDAAR
jgi:serine phosphatase RsbU (regulator of sigma subunit)/putative methionine-R-sulfoxide reductase with GAF domain